MKVMKVNLSFDIPEKRIADLLCGALEGGSHYWIESFESKGKATAKPWGEEYTPDYISAPFSEGGKVLIKDFHTEKTHTLDRAKITKGIKKFSTVETQEFLDFIKEQNDQVTADKFLQYCLFGKILYE